MAYQLQGSDADKDGKKLQRGCIAKRIWMTLDKKKKHGISMLSMMAHKTKTTKKWKGGRCLLGTRRGRLRPVQP
eukprot:12938650-Prorocentrum_lima.AAC.1